MQELKDRAVSVGLLVMIVSAISMSIAVYLHLETQSENKARAAIKVHESARLELVHPDMTRDFVLKAELQEAMHHILTLRRELHEHERLCEKKGKR